MGSAHNHWNAGRTKGVSHPIRFCNHAGHGADSDQPNPPVEGESDQFGIVHRLRVAVDQHHIVSFGCKCFQQEHPRVRHKILGDAIIRVVKQDSHVVTLNQRRFGRHSLSRQVVRGGARVVRSLDPNRIPCRSSYRITCFTPENASSASTTAKVEAIRAGSWLAAR